jgi:radical SAM protein with 4Fe4S-binding SPASM domain
MSAKYTSASLYSNRAVLQDVIPLDAPFMICADPSSYCNITCKYCVQYDVKKDKSLGNRFKKEFMSLELAKKIIDDLKQFPVNIKNFSWYGWGEPLLNPDLPEMIAYTVKSGKVDLSAVITNGILLTKEMSDRLTASGLQRINISVQGIDSEGYFDNCGRRIDFDSYVDNIRYMYEHKDDNLTMYVKIGSSLFRQPEDRQKFMDIFSGICDEIMVENIIQVRQDSISNENIEMGDSGVLGQQIKDRKVCPYLFFRMMICPDGTCALCNADWYRDNAVGNVKERSLKEIWDGEALRRLQMTHLRGERKSIELCAKCGNVNYYPVDDIDDYAELLLKRMEERKNESI